MHNPTTDPLAFKSKQVIKEYRYEDLVKRLQNMEDSGWMQVGEIKPSHTEYGVSYYAVVKWYGKDKSKQ